MDTPKRVDWLFKTVTKPDGSEYSYREVEELAGGLVSSTSIWKARVGKTTNPSQRTIQALSTAFQVPVSYFFDEDIAPEDVSQYRTQYREAQMLEMIVLRAGELDQEGKQAVLDMIDIVQKARQRSKE